MSPPAKKKTSKRARTKARGRRRAPARAAAKKQTRAAPRQTARKTKSSKGSDVERHWRTYWKCRNELEEAVAAVREAEERLAAARGLERSRREVFDQTKDSLKELLEVAPATGAGSSRAALLDFSVPEEKRGRSDERPTSGRS